MCNPLPVGKFKWVEIRKKNKFISKMLKERKFNFFIECNIEYPEELHGLHNDYPLAPEKIVIDDNFKESPYRKTIRDKFKEEYNIKLTKSKVPKLVSTLTNKKNYVVHAKLLRYYIKLGLKIYVTKILTFEEKPWMKSFIEFNIDKRTKTTNDFEILF